MNGVKFDEWLTTEITNALKLESENARLREALKFYADEETHTPVHISDEQRIDGNYVEPAFYEPPSIYFDKGKIARKALEESK